MLDAKIVEEEEEEGEEGERETIKFEKLVPFVSFSPGSIDTKYIVGGRKEWIISPGLWWVTWVDREESMDSASAQFRQ